MKQLKFICFYLVPFLVAPLMVHSQQGVNMPLLYNWDDDNIPQTWAGAYSECWGYAANGREYAFLASTQGTYFFDITDPLSPGVIDFIWNRDTTELVVNKDYATYSHYLYAVSDEGDNSLQIFDLQYLPDSVLLVYDDDALSKRCHTITVDNGRLYMASNTRYNNSYGALDVFSLADPMNPVLMGTLSHPGIAVVHEVFVRNDTAYCSNGFDGLWVYNMKFPATPSLITIIDLYAEFGYNHSSWLSNDGKTLVFTDESKGKGVKVFDLSDIQDPQLKSIVRSNLLQVPDPLSNTGSMAHIPYIVNNILLLSYYHDGVVAFDISDPSHPESIATYDTYPENTSYYGTAGCWGLYPFLPSGNIISSDIKNGLFILDGQNVLNYQPEPPVLPSISMGANPVTDEMELLFGTSSGRNITVAIYDIAGKKVRDNSYILDEGTASIQIPVNDLASGVYVAEIHSGELTLTTKVMKTKL